MNGNPSKQGKNKPSTQKHTTNNNTTPKKPEQALLSNLSMRLWASEHEPRNQVGRGVCVCPCVCSAHIHTQTHTHGLSPKHPHTSTQHHDMAPPQTPHPNTNQTAAHHRAGREAAAGADLSGGAVLQVCRHVCEQPPGREVYMYMLERIREEGRGRVGGGRGEDICMCILYITQRERERRTHHTHTHTSTTHETQQTHTHTQIKVMMKRDRVPELTCRGFYKYVPPPNNTLYLHCPLFFYFIFLIL
jgi:hypothetical protein